MFEGLPDGRVSHVEYRGGALVRTSPGLAPITPILWLCPPVGKDGPCDLLTCYISIYGIDINTRITYITCVTC